MFFEYIQKIATHTRDWIKLVPVLRRKPRVFRHWLLSARKEQIIIIALLLLVLFIVAPFFDQILEYIFSPVTKKKLFGLIETAEENPYLYDFQVFSHWLLWIGTVLVAIYLYLRHIPTTLEAAKQIAKEKEQQADLLLSSNPSESILLYDAAREWSWDEQSESALNAKLEDLNAKLSNLGSERATTPIPQTDGTVILSAEEEKKDKKAIIADRYQIDKQLGSGAMGIVYLAKDLKLSRDVALKQLSPSLSSDEHLLARFRQEALALARLSHPNIVQVYDFIEWNNLFLIVMELVEGEELENRLNRPEPLALEEVIMLATQMAEALGYAHERGVVHRDFKPANVLINKNGKVKITDFGIAKLAQSSLHTQVNTVMGSPSYMSPEQANGEHTDQRTDIYALGVILYQMLSGECLFCGDTKSIIAQHLTKAPPSLLEKRSEITPAVNSLVQKMLAKKPDDRCQSMDAVVQQLLKQ